MIALVANGFFTFFGSSHTDFVKFDKTTHFTLFITQRTISIKGPDIVRSISAGLPSDGGRPSPCFGNDRDHSRVER